jgi:hypothetical protein
VVADAFPVAVDVLDVIGQRRLVLAAMEDGDGVAALRQLPDDRRTDEDRAADDEDLRHD